MTTFSLKKYGAIALSILGLALLFSCKKGSNLVLEECTPPIDNFQFLSVDGDITGQAMIRLADGGYLLPISDSELGGGFELHWLAPDFQLRRSRRFENAVKQFLKAIWATEDQGFLLCANIREQEYSLPTDLLLIKLDKNGEEQWQKIIEGEGSQRVNTVVGTEDGGYLIAGETTLQLIGHDGLLLKVNAHGEEMWRKIVKKNFSTSIQSIARLSDGNYIYAVGHDDSVFGDATVTKISPDGTELWSWDIGGVDPWGRYFVKATADGGVVLLGNTRNNQTGSRWDNIDIFLVKLNTDGQEEWFRNYLKDEIYQPDDLVILSDGSFLILAGHPCGPDALYRTVDLALLKADPQGNELWVESYNSSRLEREYGRALLSISDDHFVIFGSAFNDISTVDVENFILQVDGNGNPK